MNNFFLTWLFNEQFVMKLKEFSIALGFHKRCILDPSELAKKHRYDQNSWWSAISNEPVSSKNSIVSIHNPTLNRSILQYLRYEPTYL